MEPGICYIKTEYQVIALKNIPSPEWNVWKGAKRVHPEKVENSEIDKEGDQNGKYQRDKFGRKERKRGQNKHRPVYKEERMLHLCHSLLEGPNGKKCTFENCKYVHDLDKYMESKGEDLAKECPTFQRMGYCPRGVTCRFAQAHLDENGNNIKSLNYDDSQVMTTLNGITSELQIRLRKREYDFTLSKNLVSKFAKIPEETKFKNSAEVVKPIGCSPDDGEVIRGRDVTAIPKVDFTNKLILSPLTTVGNLPFRRICKEYGADITCGEMACAVPLVKGLTQEWALTKRHPTEDVFGVQLCGNNPTILTQAAQLVMETAKVDFIDLNIGCPIDLIYKQGGGSALMRRSNILELAVRSCSSLTPKFPLTIKMRTGVYADKRLAHGLMPMVEEWGAAAVTLHGRSREQRYTKDADWQYIEECARKVKYIPVIGNGDIFGCEDYNEKKALAPHISSVMIGRGALIKPWIFKEIKEEKCWNPSSGERFDMLKKFTQYGLEHWGSDTKGVENARRFLLEWQSFLYRYVPYDLLLYPPQKINQRPQKFRGRDEMETLMSSSSSVDWVKLSEMLLGRVPAGFTFVPKHKANAY